MAEIYGWFTEGFETADLQEAKTLLEKCRADMDWHIYLAKARNNLRTAQSASEQSDFDSSVSRAYFAVFHVEIAALVKLTEFRQDRWGHDQVQAEFNRRLVRSRKLFSSALRFIHNDPASLVTSFLSCHSEP